MKCPGCGVENSDEARFCKSCATPLTREAAGAPVAPSAVPLPPPPGPRPRHRQPHEEFVGLLGFAFFLVALAVVFGQNPNLINDFRAWSQLASDSHTVFVRPPYAVIVSAAWFFGVMGFLELVAAGIRWGLAWTPLRSAGRALSGVGDLMFAALLVLYASRSITGTFLITVLVGVFAVLLMIYVTLGIYWSTPRAFPRPEFAQVRSHP
jgi:hypothetical protein